MDKVLPVGGMHISKTNFQKTIINQREDQVQQKRVSESSSKANALVLYTTK